MIAAERERQEAQEGWTPEHDDQHDSSELVEAAINYARVVLTITHPDSPNAAAPVATPATDWPWEASAWKPSWDDPVRNLVKAGALIAAEIDRLRRSRS
jgi:hypothetical protein